MDNFMVWVWLGIFVTAVIVEMATTELVSIWVCIGAIFGIVFSFFTPIWAQILIFAVVTAVALVATRPLLKKLKIGKSKTNTDDFEGKEVILLSDVSKFTPGTAKLNDVVYSAVLEEGVDETILSGSVVLIKGMSGNKLIIKRKEEINL